MSKYEGLYTFDVDTHMYVSVSQAFGDIFREGEQKQPLIEDKKIRKAVRAWAEANNRDVFLVKNEHFNCCRITGYTDGGNASIDRIEFSGATIAGADKDYHYTIDELCGEEEE